MTGCGSGPRYADVSGVITFNGKPYSKAYVTFQPVSGVNNENPGRGSSAETDEEGRYTLITPEGTSGAVVGKHRVSIGTRHEFLASAPGWDYSKGSPEGIELAAKGVTEKIVRDPIAAAWQTPGVEFEVTADGTDQANFEVAKAPRTKQVSAQ
jgi:hypothetical protein